MKSLFIAMTLGLIGSSATAQLCKNEPGRFVYKSATTLGEQLVISEPALVTANGLLPLGAVLKDNNYVALCTQYGYSDYVREPLLQGHTIYETYAVVNEFGTRLVKGGFKILSITCRN